MNAAIKALYSAFGVGVNPPQLSISQVALRAILIFFASLWIVRFADKRFFAKRTAFDLILGFILASMMARAINGSEPLGPTIAGGFILALLHRLLGRLASIWPGLGQWIKGSSQTLIENGKVDREMMRKHNMGDDDLLEDLRLSGLEDPKSVKLARLERSGNVSVIKKENG